MTNFEKILGLVAAPTLLLSAGCQDTGKKEIQSEKYNILFIAVDDLRPELGCYGQEHIHSPNIDELASEGVRFNRAYTQCPTSGPSRASILTGIHESDHWRADEIEEDFITMPGYLKKNGYTTLSLGKVFHHMNDRKEDWSKKPWRSDSIYHGEKDWARYNTYGLWQNDSSKKYINEESHRGPYDEKANVPDTAYQDGRLARKAINELQKLKDSDSPFFLACGFWRPHLPLNAPEKYWDLYEREEIEIADNRFRPKNLPDQVRNSGEIFQYGRVEGYYNTEAFHRETRHAYYACVSYVDAQIGKIMHALEDYEMAENTIVVLWGDHGWHLGEHDFWGKHNTLENAVRSPLIIKTPGNHGGQRDQLVELLDIYPTLIDFLGLEKPSHLEGTSLREVMRDENAPGRNAVFSKFGVGNCVITDRYIYTEWNDNDSTVARMLFDHKKDPNENKNVAGEPQYKEVVERHSKILDNSFPYSPNP
ncbi:MAG: sulfatase [Bacteroidales bacterium]